MSKQTIPKPSKSQVSAHLKIASGKGNMGRVTNVEMPWRRLKDYLREPLIDSSVTFVEYMNLPKEGPGGQDDRKQAPGFLVGGPCTNGKRDLAHMQQRHLLALDIDEASAKEMKWFEKRKSPIWNYEFFAHITRKHSPDKPRWRFLFPITRPVSFEEFNAVQRIVASQMFKTKEESMNAVDDVSFRVAQIMYLPSISHDQGFKIIENSGAVINPKSILKNFKGDWKDFSQLPHSKKRGAKKPTDPSAKAANPLTKPGPVGSFCRSYSIEEAIAEFLPHVYAPSDEASTKPRYTYLDGTTSNGAVVEDGGLFLYSHHGSDPCGGKLVNAFDMVRLHLFGDKDSKARKGTDMSKLPSIAAMKKLVSEDNQVREDRNRDQEDTIDDTHRIRAMFKDLDAVLEAENDAKGRLTFLTPEQCVDTNPRPYLWKGMLAKGDVGCIIGAPGVGKSVIAPALAYAVAPGGYFHGRRVGQGKTFYVAAEDDHGMRGRVHALYKDRGDADAFHLVSGVSDLLNEGVDGKGSPDYRALRRAVKKQRPALVVIDTLAMAFPGLEENSAEGMGRVVAIARSLTKWRAAVLLVHHDTKDGAQGLPRGHSLLNGAIDMSLHLTKGDDGVVAARLTKNRNGTSDQTIAFEIKGDRIGEDQDGDTVTAALCIESKLTAPKVILSTPNEAVLNSLRSVMDDNGKVSETDWRKEAKEDRSISASENSESRARAITRALKGLSQLGRITIRDGTISVRDSSLSKIDFTDLDADR
jgi:hypothetical protein